MLTQKVREGTCRARSLSREGRTVNHVRHWLAALALLAVITQTSELPGQTRDRKPSPPEQPVAARSQSSTRPSGPRASSRTPSAARAVRPVTRLTTRPQVSTLVDTDEPFLQQNPLEGDGACGACGSATVADATECASCAAPCQSCLFGGWIQGEYLMWWPRAMPVPPLVTRGTQASEGVLGEVGTETLVGDQMLNQMYSGGRLRLGLWSDPCHEFAWEFEGFIVGEVTDSQTFSGTGAAGSSVIARPFFNVLSTPEFPSGREDAELVAFPGQLSGTVTVEAASRLYGLGVHAMRTFDESCGPGPAAACGDCLPMQSRFAGFIGWRYLNLRENLQIHEDLTSLLPAPDNGQFLMEDRFETGNIFNGADVGVVWKGDRGRCSLDLLMRLALGSTHQDVSIAGSTTLQGSGVSGNDFQDATGGMLAQRTNIGDYSRNQFAVVPELGITLGYAISPGWRATIGYTFLYWSSVVRPGDQIDHDVNPNLFPPETTPFTGLERPAFAFAESDLWVNGLNLGLECTW
ncbi:MAG: BBP7 family outer membrane beta-barrel protein [Pirellulaceae bacterium]